MTGRFRDVQAPPAADRRLVVPPTPLGRVVAGALAAAVVVALVVWVPFVTELRAPCGAGIGAESCREPAAVLRWGQYVVGVAAAVLGVVTAVALGLYAVRSRWLPRATTVVFAFVAATAVWVALYLVSLPSLL